MWGCDMLAEVQNSTANLAEPVIRPYRSVDYASVLRGMHDLQGYERALHPSRRPAAEGGSDDDCASFETATNVASSG